jgi:predicted metal-dependent hydrolase
MKGGSRIVTMTSTEHTREDGTLVRIRRSTRRRCGASYGWVDGVLQITIPSATSRRQEAEITEVVLQKARNVRAKRTPRSDRALMERAMELNRIHLDSAAHPTSVRWVSNQSMRWGGSATPSEGSIRLSTRLQGMPTWVVDGVLVHELCHLITPGHGHDDEFRAWLARYPRHAEARAFLDGVDWVRHSAPAVAVPAEAGT